MVVFFSGCKGNTEISKEKLDRAVVSVVNKEKITVNALQKKMKTLERQFRVVDRSKLEPEELLVLKTNALNQLVQDVLFGQEVAKNGILLTYEEVEESLFTVKSGYDDDSFKKFLELEGISLEEWENKFKNNMLIKKLIDGKVNSKVSVKEEELLQYFEAHKDDFHAPQKVKALHIMVETEEEARHIQKQLKRQKRDFSDLAREYSLGPESQDGGDLGYFEAGQMPEEFDDVFKIKINQTSDIIQTPYGYHLFKVVDKKEDKQMDFESAREKIHALLLGERQDKAFKEWFVQLKENADIKIDHDVFAHIN
ncbi:MAG: peptidyl-prolyl cis-trans isomerase [Nitrospinaceae bacterium]